MLVLNLVGGWATPLKNMSSSIGSMIPNIWKNQKCSKPPTSNQLKPCHWHLLTHVHPFSRSQTRAAKNSRGRFYWRTLNRLSSAVADCMSVCPSYICSRMSREVEVPTARFGMETQRVRCGLRICFDCSSSAVQESTVQELEGSAPIPNYILRAIHQILTITVPWEVGGMAQLNSQVTMDRWWESSLCCFAS